MEPHQGSSYNPPAEAHQELLLKAAEIEKKKLEDLEKMADVKKKMESARIIQEYDIAVAPGMTVQSLDDEDEVGTEDGEEEAGPSGRKTTERKTKSGCAHGSYVPLCLTASLRSTTPLPAAYSDGSRMLLKGPFLGFFAILRNLSFSS